MRYNEPPAICVSVSKQNRRAKDIAENYSMTWGQPLSSALWRIVEEYDQMKQWSVYNRRIRP